SILARTLCTLAMVFLTSARALSRLASACRTLARKLAWSNCANCCPGTTVELKSAKSFSIVPDTCVPTCTMMTGLSVPVAETYAVMALRSTFARRYLALCCIPHKCSTLCHPTSPSMARIPTIAIHHFHGLEDGCPCTWRCGLTPELSRCRSTRLVMVSATILNKARIPTIGIDHFHGLEDGCP